MSRICTAILDVGFRPEQVLCAQRITNLMHRSVKAKLVNFRTRVPAEKFNPQTDTYIQSGRTTNLYKKMISYAIHCPAKPVLKTPIESTNSEPPLIPRYLSASSHVFLTLFVPPKLILALFRLFLGSAILWHASPSCLPSHSPSPLPLPGLDTLSPPLRRPQPLTPALLPI